MENNIYYPLTDPDTLWTGTTEKDPQKLIEEVLESIRNNKLTCGSQFLPMIERLAKEDPERFIQILKNAQDEQEREFFHTDIPVVIDTENMKKYFKQ